MFLKAPENKDGETAKDPYSGRVYSLYKSFLQAAIRMKYVTLALVIALFVTSLWGFGFVKQSFFPPSTRPQFMVDIWLPQGTHIDDTVATVATVEQHILSINGVTHVTSLVGKGGLRFLLTYTPEKLNSAYAQLMVDVESTDVMDEIVIQVEDYLDANYEDMLGYASKFQLGPGSTGKIQARFSGPDRDVLRGLAEQTQAIYRADHDAKAVRTDWRQRVKMVRPVLAEEQANLNGITRPDIANTLLDGFQGRTVGVYREGDLLLPIILRAEDRERTNIDSMGDLQIWSPAAEARIPIRQVVSGFETVFEDEIIERRNRKPTITVFADPDEGYATALYARVAPQVEALDLPPGYELEWGGEYEDSADAQAGLAGGIPVFFLFMVLITIMLFNSLKQPLIIWLTVPLAVIGVAAGLLLSGQPFGFMALLGMLSLSGMLIKNAIVLIDEINYQVDVGNKLSGRCGHTAHSRNC